MIDICNNIRNIAIDAILAAHLIDLVILFKDMTSIVYIML